MKLKLSESQRNKELLKKMLKELLHLKCNKQRKLELLMKKSNQEFKPKLKLSNKLNLKDNKKKKEYWHLNKSKLEWLKKLKLLHSNKVKCLLCKLRKKPELLPKKKHKECKMRLMNTQEYKLNNKKWL